MKSRTTIIGAVLILVGIMLWMALRGPQGNRSSDARPGQSQVDPKHGRETKKPGNGTPTPATNLAEMWRRFEIAFDRRALDAAIATGDPYKWQPIMLEALHFNLPREKGIALLKPYLTHSDPYVRAMAAQHLFTLGSREGGPVLVAFIKEAAAGVAVGVDLSVAADVLRQYRYPIDANLVFAAYQKTGNALLLKSAELLGSEQAIPEAKQKLKSHGILDGGLTMAGFMRINDPDSMRIYEANFASENAYRREKAAAALYRATGESRYLDYLTAVAEAAVGLRPREGYLDYSSFNGNAAFMVLQQTVSPQTTAALRRIEAAARKHRDAVEADRALVGLFYFHRDYDYIDQLIMDQFTGKLSEGLLIGSIWDLAATRRTAEIEAAAKAYNREAYEREFLRKAGRPVESWVFKYISSDIPWYALPQKTD